MIVTSYLKKRTLLVSCTWMLILSLNVLANWCKFFLSVGFKYMSQIYLNEGLHEGFAPLFCGYPVDWLR